MSHDLLISSRIEKIELYSVLGYSWANLIKSRIQKANELANYVTLGQTMKLYTCSSGLKRNVFNVLILLAGSSNLLALSMTTNIGNCVPTGE